MNTLIIYDLMSLLNNRYLSNKFILETENKEQLPFLDDLVVSNLFNQ